MNGVVSASGSAGSSQRVASGTWAANVSVPAGCAAAGPVSSRSDRQRIARAVWVMGGSIAPPHTVDRAPLLDRRTHRRVYSSGMSVAQPRFRDRHEAGRRLADKLAAYAKRPGAAGLGVTVGGEH